MRLWQVSLLSWICSALTAKGNPYISTRFDPVVKSGLQAYALAKEISLSQLVRNIVMEWVHEVTISQKGVTITLDRVNALVSTHNLPCWICSDLRRLRADGLLTARLPVKYVAALDAVARGG
jgi:hypothetical protein